MATKTVCDRCGVETKSKSLSVTVELNHRLSFYDLCVGCGWMLSNKFMKGGALDAVL